MSFFAGSFANGSNGNVSVSGIGFQPSYLRFTIAYKNGSSNVIRYGVGYTDGFNEFNHWIYGDSSGFRTISSNSRCCGVADRISGNIVDKCDGSFVSFDSDGFTLNFTNADSNYTIYVEAFA